MGKHTRLELSKGRVVHVWQPDGDPQGIVVYLHGHNLNPAELKGHATSADWAWAQYNLEKQFSDSGVKALFLVIQAQKGNGDNIYWPNLTELLEEVKAGSGPVSAVGHSGAYTTIAKWLKHPRLKHVTLLDALYGSVGEYREFASRTDATFDLIAATQYPKRHPKGHPQQGEYVLDGNGNKVLTGPIVNSRALIDGLKDDVKKQVVKPPGDEIPTAISEDLKKAKILYVSNSKKYEKGNEHMALVTSGEVIPVLIRRAPLEKSDDMPEEKDLQPSKPPPKKEPDPLELKTGAKGLLVEQVQNEIIARGQPITADGKWGPRSQGALEAVLATAGVKVPSPLMSDKAIEALRESDRVRAPVAGDRPLVNGAKGEDIRALQRQMNERGAGIKADGEWGPKSQAAFDKLLGPIASALGFFYPITLQTALYAMKLLSGSSGTTPPPPAPSGGAANEPLSISEPNGYSGWWGDDEEEREKELPPVPENVVNVGAAPGPVPPSKKHSKEPPEVKGLPFAPAGTGLFWPVRTLAKEGREVNMSGRYVGAKRPAKGAPTRHHCAIDLYGNLNDPVVACEDGRIVVFKHFYRGVYCILVQCDSGSVINYGEVDPESLNFAGLPVQQKGTIEVKKEDGSLFKRVPNYVLIPGNDYRVKAGQVIGKIGKMYNDSMLHFEMYQQGTTSTSQWKLSDKSPPKSLLNPGRYLVHLAEHGK